MASFDSTNAFQGQAFDFDAFFRDFDLGLGKDTLALTNQPVTLQTLTEVDTNLQALTLTTYVADIGTAAFDIVSFDENLSFDNNAFSLDDDLSIQISATTNALTVATYQSTVEGALNLIPNPDALVVTTFNVTLDDPFVPITDVLTLTEFVAGLQIGSEIINVPNNLVLTEYPASVAQSFVGSIDNLILTERQANLGTVINVNFDSLIVNEQIATIEVGSPANLNIGTALRVLNLTEQNMTFGYSPEIFANKDTLAIQPYSSIVNYVTEPILTSPELIVTTYATTIGFNWDGPMKTAQLFLYTRGLSKASNIFSITQPIPTNIPDNIPEPFE